MTAKVDQDRSASTAKRMLVSHKANPDSIFSNSYGPLSTARYGPLSKTPQNKMEQTAKLIARKTSQKAITPTLFVPEASAGRESLYQEPNLICSCCLVLSTDLSCDIFLPEKPAKLIEVLPCLTQASQCVERVISVSSKVVRPELFEGYMCLVNVAV